MTYSLCMGEEAGHAKLGDFHHHHLRIYVVVCGTRLCMFVSYSYVKKIHVEHCVLVTCIFGDVVEDIGGDKIC